MIWIPIVVFVFLLLILFFGLKKRNRITNKFFIKNQFSSFIQTGILVLAFTVFFSFLIGSFSYLNNNNRKLKESWNSQRLTQNFLISKGNLGLNIQLKVDKERFITESAFKSCTDANYERKYKWVSDIPIITKGTEVGIAGEKITNEKDWEDNKYLYDNKKINFCFYRYVKNRKDPIFSKPNFKVNLSRIVTFIDFNQSKLFFIYDLDSLFDKKSNQYQQNIPILEKPNIKLPKDREIFLHKRYADLNNITLDQEVDSGNSFVGIFKTSNFTKFNPNILNSALPVFNQRDSTYRNFFVGGVSKEYFNNIILRLKNYRANYNYTISISFHDSKVDFKALNLVLPLLNRKFENSFNYIIDTKRDNSNENNIANIFVREWDDEKVKILATFNAVRNLNNFAYAPTLYAISGTADLSLVFSVIIVVILIIMIFIFLRIIIIKRQNVIGILKSLGYNSNKIAFSLSLSFFVLILISFLISFAIAPLFSLFWNNLIFNGILFTKAAIFNFPDIAFISLFFIIVPIIIIFLLVRRRTKKLLVRDLIYETSVVKPSFLVEKTTPILGKLPFWASYPLKNVFTNLTRASSIFIFSFITIFIFMFIFATLNIYPNFRESFNRNYHINNVDIVGNDTALKATSDIELINSEQARNIVNQLENEYNFGFDKDIYEKIIRTEKFSEFNIETKKLEDKMYAYLTTENVNIKNYFKIWNMISIRNNLKDIMTKGFNYCYDGSHNKVPDFFDLIDPKLPDCDNKLTNIIKEQYISSVIFTTALKYTFDRVESNFARKIPENSSIIFNKYVFKKNSSIIKITQKDYSDEHNQNLVIYLNGIDSNFNKYIKYKDRTNGLDIFSSLKNAKAREHEEIPSIISSFAFKILKLRINDIISFKFKKIDQTIITKKFKIIGQTDAIESWNLYYLNEQLNEIEDDGQKYAFDKGQSDIYIMNSEEKKKYFGFTSGNWKTMENPILVDANESEIIASILNSALMNLTPIHSETSATRLISTLTNLFDVFLDFILIFIVILMFNFILLLFTLSYQILLKSDKDKEILKKLGFSTVKNVNTITSPVIFLNVLALAVFLPIAILVINLVRNFIWSVTLAQIPIYLSIGSLILVIIFYILFNLVFWLISYFGVRKKKKS